MKFVYSQWKSIGVALLLIFILLIRCIQGNLELLTTVNAAENNKLSNDKII